MIDEIEQIKYEDYFHRYHERFGLPAEALGAVLTNPETRVTYRIIGLHGSAPRKGRHVVMAEHIMHGDAMRISVDDVLAWMAAQMPPPPPPPADEPVLEIEGAIW